MTPRTPSRPSTIVLACALGAAAALAGCAGTGNQPSPRLAPEPLRPVAVPAACDDVKDPVWTDLPDADIRADEAAGVIARNHRQNKIALAHLKGLRRACSAGLKPLADGQAGTKEAS